MTKFTIYNKSNAPEASKKLLEESEKTYGMIPNLHGVMAESPEILEAYKAMGNFFSKSSLTPEEINVIWLTINVENKCHYCVPAHTAIAKSMKVGDDVINALRDQKPLPNQKLEALRTFTQKLIRERGNVNDESVQAFLDAGYTKKNIFEVILGYSQKIMSNYVNHLADTPIDDPFKDFEWKAK